MKVLESVLGMSLITLTTTSFIHFLNKESCHSHHASKEIEHIKPFLINKEKRRQFQKSCHGFETYKRKGSRIQKNKELVFKGSSIDETKKTSLF
ncbi:MAG: hypothetical protein ACPGJV_04010 [Bacteriovoracaceae bacterium]